MEDTCYSIGIDVGSTTVKTVIINEQRDIVYSKYSRHFSKVKETVLSQIKEFKNDFKDKKLKLSITGSAGLGIASKASLLFVQEVHAAFLAVKETYDDADAVIELGGEDAKIIFLSGAVEQRMNGSCAGGTGAFIDQMASLLGVTPDELDDLALKAEKKYSIASRCGVFAKSDVQPLINQGAKREDISASILQAVVDQTVSGLAQGRKIEGKILFLGGPLTFFNGLRKAFIETLKLSEEDAIFPDEAPLFMALGSALYAESKDEFVNLEDVIAKIESTNSKGNVSTLDRLFTDKHEYDEFIERHNEVKLEYADIKIYEGNAYLGIDAGSTTTKICLITEDGKLLYDYYSLNNGEPLDKIAKQIKEIYSSINPRINIKSSAITGYGEDLIKSALKVDFGIVETVAHYKAASYFQPNVDFIIDIGGQDIKCFKIRNGVVDSIMLNEACSSGCGSFIHTFAIALGHEVEEFAKLGLFAERPVNLGSRCTVFMNSSVKQAQKDGATVEDISAGLSASIIKNAIYKVIRAKSIDDLGEHIVVQGGTFLNDAVLRSFEMELGKNVVRPTISGHMGAFGCALYAKEKSNSEHSTLISKETLDVFTYTSKPSQCKSCTANCRLTVLTFSDGSRFISGNKCEKGAGIKKKNENIDIYQYKYVKLMELTKPTLTNPIATVGIPRVLNFYEQIPFWKAFFNNLNIEVVTSNENTREVYLKGQDTIPSDTVCYPAKLAHGAIKDLLDKNINFIFYPNMSYNLKEGSTDNHYNCPVVAYYPELLKANISELTTELFLCPHIDLNNVNHTASVLTKIFSKYNFKKKHIKSALDSGFNALTNYQKEIMAKGEEIIEIARKDGKKIIILAGRPYHIDQEINHGINKLISELDLAVVSEDSVFHLGKDLELNVLNQWTYHSRLYKAAEFVTTQNDMELVQLVSFGCGIDAITTDEIRDILETKGKLYTQIKIDEINNLGAAKIRLRSLLATMTN